jgi:hypothetical protein
LGIVEAKAGLAIYFLNIETIQMMITITTMTEMMPTTAPALNIPVITEQLLRQSANNANDK